MTLEQFAARFDVSHPAVLKWERAKNHATGMIWSTEKDIRLFALHNITLKPQEFLVVYQQLSTIPSTKPGALKIDFAA